MGRDIRQAGARHIRFEQLPDDLLAHPVPANLISPVDGPEQIPLGHACLKRPCIDRVFVYAGIGIVRTLPYLPMRSTMR
jgi:hypothetical protein